MCRTQVPLGHYAPAYEPNVRAKFICDVVGLRPFVAHPSFQACAAERSGGVVAGPSRRWGKAVVPDDVLSRHALLVGATGTGKTRTLEHLVMDQFGRGYSAVVIDPKRGNGRPAACSGRGREDRTRKGHPS